jgi:hypothetical protein
MLRAACGRVQEGAVAVFEVCGANVACSLTTDAPVRALSSRSHSGARIAARTAGNSGGAAAKLTLSVAHITAVRPLGVSPLTSPLFRLDVALPTLAKPPAARSRPSAVRERFGTPAKPKSARAGLPRAACGIQNGRKARTSIRRTRLAKGPSQVAGSIDVAGNPRVGHCVGDEPVVLDHQDASAHRPDPRDGCGLPIHPDQARLPRPLPASRPVLRTCSSLRRGCPGSGGTSRRRRLAPTSKGCGELRLPN